MDETFLRAHASDFENFWHRRLDGSVHELRYPGYGYDIHLETNSRDVLDAAQLAAGRCCLSNGLEPRPGIELRVMVVPSLPGIPVPDDLPAILQTVAVGDTMFQAATPWVQWVTDLNARRAHAVISPALAAQPRLVSRYLIDRAVNNILLREGVGQVHSTTLVRDDCALLFIAPHGTGKSTTAFHLLNAGYRLMGDGLLFAREPRSHGDSGTGEFELMGYPVGEAKLTTAARSLFPEWRGEGDEVSVHNIVKHIVNLRTLAPHKMIDHAIFPKRVILCLAERNEQPLTVTERNEQPLTVTERNAQPLTVAERSGHPLTVAERSGQSSTVAERSGQSSTVTQRNEHPLTVTERNAQSSTVTQRSGQSSTVTEHNGQPSTVVENNAQSLTFAERLDPETAFARVLPDTIQLDEPEAMLRSLNVLRRLIAHASCYRLILGSDPTQLVETINSLT